MPERLPELTLEAKRAGLIQFMEVAKKASFNTQKVLIDGRKCSMTLKLRTCLTSARHPSSLQPKTCSFSWTT